MFVLIKKNLQKKGLRKGKNILMKIEQLIIEKNERRQILIFKKRHLNIEEMIKIQNWFMIKLRNQK